MNKIDEKSENNAAKEMLKVIGEYSKVLDLLEDYNYKKSKKIDAKIDKKMLLIIIF